ncbi:MAG: TonB-dependent receptor [Hydrogenophilaceae bacterium]|jgi:iron complex outermembrane receptor protein|nr:TonB-dependent receptor [Hydrogenophilaceae bacterium]
MNKVAKRALFWATTVLSLAVPAMAQAQTTTEEEIVVTARRRAESQQDVPLAVTALNAAQLERANVTDINSLQGTVPNLVISPGQGSGGSTPVFAIRGLSQQDLTHLSDPSVSLYINDVVIPRPIGGNVGLFDVSSVQVLRGPQGTLFGRNTPGGAVLVTTNTPSDEFEARIAQTIAEYDTYQTEGVLNFAVGSGLSVRIAGMHRESEGYVFDTVAGQNMDFVDENAYRVSLDFHPTDTFESLFVIDSATTDNGGTGVYARPGSIGGAAQLARDHYTTASGTPVHSDVDIFSITNTTSLQLGDITLRNIVGFRELDNDTLEDPDGSAAFVLPIQRVTEHEQVSEEFQILGDAGWGDWIVGAYYFSENGSDQGLSSGLFAGCPTTPQNLTFTDLRQYACFSNTWSTAENTSTAIFGQVTFNLGIEGLSATVGARQNWDERNAVILNRTATNCRFTVDHDDNPATPEVNPGLAGCSLALSADFSEPTYNVSLEYRATDDLLLYAAHRHGYRTGGFGARAANEAGLSRTFEPEIVDDIEVGVKADWRPGNMFLRTNLALFFAEYKDIQRLLSDPTLTPPQTVTTNAGQAEIQGAEFELLFRPNPWLEFTGFYAYTDADFTEFIAPNGADLSIFPFARAPRNIAGAGVRVDLPMSESLGSANLGVNYFHQDSYSTNDSFIPGVTIDEGRDIVDFVAEWNDIMGSSAGVTFFVKNAFDNDYSTSVLGLGAATVNSAAPGEPQTFGVRLRYSFGD